MNLRHRDLVTALCLASAPAALHAQGRGVQALPRLSQPVQLDGLVGDAAWRDVAPLPVTMHAPRFGGTPAESTTIWVAYDDDHLYVAGRFRDARPRELRINSLYRDRWSGDDAFAIYLDTFNDNENGLWFLTNPAGIRMDFTISDDGDVTSDSWNALWDVATRVTEEGWSAEMRIPFASLRFEARDGRVVMGLTVTRLMARLNERVTFPAIDPRYNFRQPSVMQDVELTGIRPRRPAYVTPYALGGMNRDAVLAAGGAAFAADREAVHELGGDLKVGLSDNVNLDLTVNTDFAQVEADDQQINLTRFPLFFPEKRQFFQERAGVFLFDFSSGGRLFHSRRIGLADDATPIRMLGGARVVARAGAWDIAALDVQTARRDSAVGSENLGVLRLRRRVLNTFSYAGAMLTTRTDEAGAYNVGAGLDASLRMFGTDYLTARGAATFDDADSAAGLVGRGQVFLRWERRSARGLSYFAEGIRVGDQYRPELGFLPRADFTRWALYSEYNHFPGDGSPLRSHGPGAIVFEFRGNADGRLQSGYYAAWWRYQFRNGASGWLESIHHVEDVRAAFPLGDGVMVDTGTHRYTELWFNYQPATGPRMRAGLDARAGGFYDGWRIQATVSPTWNVSRHLELGGSWEYNHIRFDERNTGLDLHVARLRVGSAANARLSAIALVQYNSVQDRAWVNLRVRYNFREGSDLWLVWDEGFFTDRDPASATPGAPRLPLSEARALRVKLTHTLVFGG